MKLTINRPVRRVEITYADGAVVEPVVVQSGPYLAGDGEEPPPTDPAPPDIIIEN